MADLKISQLGSIITVVPATDVLPVVQGGTTYKVTPNQLLGAGGTATLASATITGDLTVDTSTLKVDSTNNRVGIGTASPSYDLQVNGATNGRIQVEGASGFGMVFIQGSSGNTAQLQLNSSGGSGKRYALSSISTGSFSISDETASASRFVIDTSGDVSISTGNVVMGTSGKGIDFSATASGSGTMQSELLADYEEGTWTPVATGLTNVGAVTYTATYTKIGRVVYINLKVSAVTSTTSVANTTYFSGLPFTPAQNSTVTAVNEGNITSLGVGLIATGSTVFTPNWTAVQNATLSGFYYV